MQQCVSSGMKPKETRTLAEMPVNRHLEEVSRTARPGHCWGGDASPGQAFRSRHQGAWFLCLFTERLTAVSSVCTYSEAVCPWLPEPGADLKGARWSGCCVMAHTRPEAAEPEVTLSSVLHVRLPRHVSSSWACANSRCEVVGG